MDLIYFLSESLFHMYILVANLDKLRDKKWQHYISDRQVDNKGCTVAE